jgi:hypothetical protein
MNFHYRLNENSLLIFLEFLLEIKFVIFAMFPQATNKQFYVMVQRNSLKSTFELKNMSTML